MSRVLCCLAFILLFSDANAHGNNDAFTIDDYFKISRISEVAISSNGEMVAYKVQSPSLSGDKSMAASFVSSVSHQTEPRRVDEIRDARNFSWVPGTQKLAYLSDADGIPQVYSFDTRTDRTRQHTDEDAPVEAYRFASDGSSFAWTVQSPSLNAPSFYDRISSGEESVVVDVEHTIVYQFTHPAWPDVTSRSSNNLWIKSKFSEKAERIRVPGKVTGFFWSSDAKFLSVIFVDDRIPLEPASEKFTSIGIYDVLASDFQVVAQARTSVDDENAIHYSGGQWIPDENALIVGRTQEIDRWSHKSDWSIFDLSNNLKSPDRGPWRPIDTYGAETFVPINRDLIYSTTTIRARKFLYEITPNGPAQATVFEGASGAVSDVRFSADYSTAAFVNENIDRPPEIYIWQKGHKAKQLTNLNGTITGKRMPRAREVHWHSNDGVLVQGWLFEPAGDDDKPWPLITFVHGGPAFAFSNEFAAYFSLWPTPIEAYANKGMAVFVPNYRGTGTFGYDFGNPSTLALEPVDDIVSGINYLIGEKIVDRDRLAIAGHSHGAWLGAQVMIKARVFQAASFAEGGINPIVNYNLMPEWLNRDVHDIQNGVSLYDDPNRYIELSPDLHFKDLNTAVLFEAGARISAIGMMGSPKAARRAGMPSEFIIYPKTDHSIRIPHLQKESADRNLDWFRFWLQGYEDQSPEKVSQYTRWRLMRNESCAKDYPYHEEPSYCSYR